MMIAGPALSLWWMHSGGLRDQALSAQGLSRPAQYGNTDWTSPGPSRCPPPGGAAPTNPWTFIDDHSRGTMDPEQLKRLGELLASLRKEAGSEAGKCTEKEQEMTKEPCFYVVWRIGGEAPTRTHDNPDAAKAEARRLALKCRGEKFVVLKSVSSHVSHEVIDSEYSEYGDGEEFEF